MQAIHRHCIAIDENGGNMNWQARLIVAVLTMCSLSLAGAAELSEEQRALHVLNRLGYGPRPGDVEHVVNVGVDRYIELQLEPEKIRLPNELLNRLDTLTSQDMPVGDLLTEFVAVNKAAKAGDSEAIDKRKETLKLIAEQTAEERLARAIDSPAQLEEVMVDFWFNHFNVFEGKGQDRAFISSYERDAIRPYVLGHFREMLGATAKHPAMLFYLDNWMSVAPGFNAPGNNGGNANQKLNGLNENYAREVMELHTLGVDGGYTQRDVTELARMLTGWTYNPQEIMKGGATFRFAPRRHDKGDKDWLGKHIGARGQQEGEWALDILAAHPATAHHISYQLAQYFVSDVPPPALVDKLAKRFQETQGDIREVLRTLFVSKEFWDAAKPGTKFKTPYQFVVSTARATGMNVANIRPLLGILRQLGMPLYGCLTPDGYKNTEDAWLNPDALTRRINFATAFASGKLPITRNPDDDTGLPMTKEQAAKAVQAPAVDAQMLLATLGSSISNGTRETIEKNPPKLRAAMVLGSPDFMLH
jgi:uncharacterized protein (DUF1800 family)